MWYPPGNEHIPYQPAHLKMMIFRTSRLVGYVILPWRVAQNRWFPPSPSRSVSSNRHCVLVVGASTSGWVGMATGCFYRQHVRFPEGFLPKKNGATNYGQKIKRQCLWRRYLSFFLTSGHRGIAGWLMMKLGVPHATIWVVVSNIFYFHPYFGKIPILTNVSKGGWNHQLLRINPTVSDLLEVIWLTFYHGKSLPASSNWPFDSPNGGHLSHEKGHRSNQGRFEELGGEYVF